MARKSRKNMMLQENTALPDKEKKVLFKAGLYARLSHEKEENIERGTIESKASRSPSPKRLKLKMIKLIKRAGINNK